MTSVGFAQAPQLKVSHKCLHVFVLLAKLQHFYVSDIASPSITSACLESDTSIKVEWMVSIEMCMHVHFVLYNIVAVPPL